MSNAILVDFDTFEFLVMYADHNPPGPRFGDGLDLAILMYNKRMVKAHAMLKAAKDGIQKEPPHEINALADHSR